MAQAAGTAVFDAASYVKGLTHDQIWSDIPFGTNRFGDLEGADLWEVQQLLYVGIRDDNAVLNIWNASGSLGQQWRLPPMKARMPRGAFQMDSRFSN